MIIILNRKYSKNQKLLNRKTTLKQYLSLYDVITKQIVLLISNEITYYVKWACLYYKISVSHIHSYNCSLKVVFLFQSFLVLTVTL